MGRALMSIQCEWSCERLCFARGCAYFAHMRSLEGMLFLDVLSDIMRTGEQSMTARPGARMRVLSAIGLGRFWTVAAWRHVRELRMVINLGLEHQLTTLLVSGNQADPRDECAAAASTGLYMVGPIL